jgi:hypothetical protein
MLHRDYERGQGRGDMSEPEKDAKFWSLRKHKEENLTGDPGRSLTQEVAALREQVQQLCAAVRQLVQLQSVANQKLDAALKGNADCSVL